MTSPIFIDANVPIYVGGRPHPLRDPSVRALNLVAEHPRLFVTDAEVLQELLHRYTALRTWATGRENFDLFRVLMEGRTESITAGDVVTAAHLADRYENLAARNLLHLATMQRLGCDRILTADRGFAAVDGITQLDPRDVASWEAEVRAEAP